MSRQEHPDPEELASYQAGLIGGLRGRRLAAHLADCTRCASVSDQLAALGPALASVPATPMPDAVERQITAAIAAEAATRQGESRQAAASPAGAGPAANGVRPRRPRMHGFRPAMAAIPVAASLLAGLGYLLSQTGSSAGPSGAMSAAAAPASLPTVAVSGHAAAGTARGPTMGGLRPQANQPRVPFVVIASGISYQKATLGAQVRRELDSNAGGSNSTYSAGPAKSQSAASSGAGSAPPQALIGCVLHVTGDAAPRLVDRATYAGEPAYVIAVTDRVWVVGLGCTESHPDLITSATLPQ
jgi:hypothetical protein